MWWPWEGVGGKNLASSFWGDENSRAWTGVPVGDRTVDILRYPWCSYWKSCQNLSTYNEVTAIWKSGGCVILINRWLKQKRSIDVSRCNGWSQGVGVSPCCQLLPLLPSSCPRAPCPCLLVYHFCLLGAGKLLHWACSNCCQVSK